MDPEHWQALGTAIAIGLLGVLNDLKGRRKDKSQTKTLDQHFAQLAKSIDRRFNTVDTNIAEVRAFCVGPDGENGFRKDIGEIKDRVGGLEERERERLERSVGQLDRRTV